jgi:hypothetical protein
MVSGYPLSPAIAKGVPAAMRFSPFHFRRNRHAKQAILVRSRPGGSGRRNGLLLVVRKDVRETSPGSAGQLFAMLPALLPRPCVSPASSAWHDELRGPGSGLAASHRLLSVIGIG